jgi:hypothetical protein
LLKEGVGVMESADGEEGERWKGSRTGRLTAGFDGVVGVVVTFLVLVRCRRRSCTGRDQSGRALGRDKNWTGVSFDADVTNIFGTTDGQKAITP